jgi:hypothetical protein
MVIRRTSPRAEALLESAADVWVAEHPDEMAAYSASGDHSTSGNPFVAAAEKAFWRVFEIVE